MSLSGELSYLDAGGLAALIRNRDVSPVEVVEAFTARIEQRNPSLNAFVYFGFEDARKEAKAAEQALSSGAVLGPLHGVPIAIKDLFDFKPGWVSTFGGIRAFANHVVPFYCIFAERMERAGAIILGKTNSPVLGFRGTCDNYLFGPTRNPFNTTKNSGGSSGGSAAVVADGLVPLAEGSDAGGSIRIPASWCGVYGFKPSAGRVPLLVRPNAFGASAPFITEGPITRTVADAALALTAISGSDPRDPCSAGEPSDFTAAMDRSIKGWKIAYSPNFDVFPVDPQVSEVVGQSIKAFEEAGAHVEEIKVGIKRSQRELSDTWCRLIMPLTVQTLDVFKQMGIDVLAKHPEDLPPELHHWIERTRKTSVLDFFNAQVIRSEVFDAIEAVFDTHDLLITPTLACLPADNAADGNTKGPTSINGEEVDPLIGWCLTYLLNFTGHPAASVPAGLSRDGLPVGMQIIGRRHGDGDVLAASAAFEQRRPWRDSYRVCAGRSL
jgi:amidase/aspartyl-tRNA(Asn)/glutamyl-tRNA(Gln) amidotransferase subunit A